MSEKYQFGKNSVKGGIGQKERAGGNVTKKDIIRCLRNYPLEQAGEEQIRRCVNNMPEMKGRYGLRELLLLQFQYAPRGFYVAMVTFFCLFAGSVRRLVFNKMLLHFSLAQCILLFLLIGYLFMSNYTLMNEIEGSCRFGREKMFFARMLWGISFLFIFLLLGNVILFSGYRQEMLFANIFCLIPMLFGIWMMLTVLDYVDIRGEILLLLIFFLCCAAGNFLYYFFYEEIREHMEIILILFLIAVCIDVLKVKNIMERNWKNECYGI